MKTQTLYDMKNKIESILSLFHSISPPEGSYTFGSYTFHRKDERKSFYSYEKYDEKKYYIIDDELRKMLKDYLLFIIEQGKIVSINKLAESLIRNFKIQELKPKVMHRDCNGDDQASSCVSYKIYEATPAPLLVEHKYTTYCNSCSNYRKHVSYYFATDFNNENDREAETFFREIKEKAREIVEICNNEEMHQKIYNLLLRGYQIQRTDEFIGLVGSTSTSVAWWRGEYEVLCGEVKTVEDELECEWGSKKSVKITPKTNVAVIKYYSDGSMRGWQEKSIVILDKYHHLRGDAL